MEQLQHQARVSETLRRLAVKSGAADEKGKAEQSDKPATPQPGPALGSSDSGSSSGSVSGSASSGSPPRGPEEEPNSEEDDPDLRLAISLSLGQDW